MHDVFATADHRFGRRQLAQLRAQGKGALQTQGKIPLLAQPAREIARFGIAPCRGPSGGFSLDQRLLQAADAGQLTHTKHALNRAFLQGIDLDRAIGNLAAQEPRQFQVWRQTESTASQSQARVRE